jgi:hypothetical protein
MILILTEPDDVHADAVIERLKQRRAEWFRFNPADFPARANVSLGFEPDGRTRALLRTAETTIDLTRLRSVWYRRPQPPVPHEQITNDAVRSFVAEDCLVFLRDLWHTIECRWLPGNPMTIRAAELKAAQLRIAGELGLELPPTLVTNEPDEFLDFYRQHKGNIVTKLAGTSFHRSFGNHHMRFTEVVSRRDLGHVSSIRHCPVILQAYVPKRLELRITVVGQQVFAAEIHSQETHHTRHDWRRYDLDHTPHVAHDLPPDVREKCVRLVERLGLTYGAIDMILTPDGRYVFVEINPNGQYLWIEQKTGLPISEAVCDFLMNERGAMP